MLRRATKARACLIASPIALRAADRTICAVEDFGRWFADAAGRPARAHGVLRVLQRNEETHPVAAASDSPPAWGRWLAASSSTKRWN